MALKRQPVEEPRPLPPKGVRDALAAQHRGERGVGGGDALRRGDQIGLDVEVGAAEQITEPADATDDLVHDLQDAGPITECLDLLEVLYRAGTDAAACVLDRLGDVRPDLLRPLELDQSLDLVVAGEGADGCVAAVRAALPNGLNAGWP